MKACVFIEQRSGKIKSASLEALSKACELSSGNVTAILIGDNGIEAQANLLGKYGAKKVNVFQNETLRLYAASAYTKLVSKVMLEAGATDLFFASTSLGKDLAPRVAVRLGAGVASDCIELLMTNGNVQAKRYAYSGKAIATVELKSELKIYTLRPNVFPQVETPVEPEITVSAFNPETADLKEMVKEIIESSGKLDVSEADIVVSGGRGLKEPSNFVLVENLANALGGAVGASRAVVDAGWRPHEEQVGQTGKVVSPKLYIAVGISGAVQHLAGMTASKVIVAINKDKDAPIFQIADYGIVGDALEVLPALTEEFKKILQN
ncbi:MAG: electron transfer flavoprotein subunit alpha/FixB family protein [Chloroherpetonaceae bacterium]|nr:electron transfer flavoprotein subunit alpha/FixB family protein [Chloroherpetonaceae bacterium]